jgi:hypothetical protein
LEAGRGDRSSALIYRLLSAESNLLESFVMRQRVETIAAYFGLFLLSLPIPLLDYRITEDTIRRMTPIFPVGDGKWEYGLTPGDLLMLRGFGHLSWWIPLIVLVMFALSFWLDVFAQFSTICLAALLQCGFATVYAVSVVMVLMIRH